MKKLNGLVIEKIDVQRVHNIQAGIYRKGLVPATQENIIKLKEFLSKHWDIALLEMAEDTVGDLSHSCLPVSLFTNVVFGGILEGTERHVYNIISEKTTRGIFTGRFTSKNEPIYERLPVPQILDMTENSKSTKELGWVWDNDQPFMVSDGLFKMLEEYVEVINGWIDSFNTEFSNQQK